MEGRPVVPAPFVPEDLVSQTQVVLQEKSRNLIIRELQRTNLDVNLAVNNLLSRDDEDVDDMDDSQGSYLPSDDLLSLLDAGIYNDHASVIIDVDAVHEFENDIELIQKPLKLMYFKDFIIANEHLNQLDFNGKKY
jgi:E3 ubiquitin-protein ligase EDD1